MGGGSWTTSSYTSYTKTKGIKTSCLADGTITLDSSYDVQDLYKARKLDEALDPKGVVRECVDSDEHPNTIPVILALDVTGSMGSALEEVSKKLNAIMTETYKKVKDVEFLVMGIGDLAYDDAPIQAYQFESDIRIVEQLDKVYFERGGGGNQYESYTAAWYFAINQTKLDAWKRGKKGILITLGDEPLNPYLPKEALKRVTGNETLQGDVETKELYNEVIKKYDVYHFAINDSHTCYRYYRDDIKETWGKYLDNNHFKVVTLNELAAQIVSAIVESSDSVIGETEACTSTDGISW